MEGLLFLGVSEFPIKHPAMGFDDGQARELSGGLTVSQDPEVAPVDLELFSHRGFEAEVVSLFLGPDLLQVIPEDGDPPGIALGDQALL
jgi:hypothetical protein